MIDHNYIFKYLEENLYYPENTESEAISFKYFGRSYFIKYREGFLGISTLLPIPMHMTDCELLEMSNAIMERNLVIKVLIDNTPFPDPTIGLEIEQFIADQNYFEPLFERFIQTIDYSARLVEKF